MGRILNYKKKEYKTNLETHQETNQISSLKEHRKEYSLNLPIMVDKYICYENIKWLYILNNSTFY